jgi:hypothetical protein
VCATCPRLKPFTWLVFFVGPTPLLCPSHPNPLAPSTIAWGQVFQEVVLGIKVVKAYGWESSFLEKVMAIRKKESTAQLSLAYLQAIVFPISIAMPIAAITATFAVRVAVEGACSPGDG